jgi:hypothetical protein
MASGTIVNDVNCTNPACAAPLEVTFAVTNALHFEPHWFYCPCCREVNRTKFPERLVAVASKSSVRA